MTNLERLREWIEYAEKKGVATMRDDFARSLLAELEAGVKLRAICETVLEELNDWESDELNSEWRGLREDLRAVLGAPAEVRDAE